MSFRLGKDTADHWVAYAPQQIDGWPHGYVNQARFYSYTEFTLTIETSPGFTDVVTVDLSDMSYRPLTETAYSEFSPVMTRAGALYTLTVEGDQREVSNPQRIWYHDTKQGFSAPLLGEQDDIGYYEPLTASTLIVYKIGSPSKLAYADLKSSDLQYLVTDPGRCIKKLSETSFAYVQNISENTRYLKIYDLQSRQSDFIIGLPRGVEDFDLLPDGSFVCATSTGILRHEPRSQTGWTMIYEWPEGTSFTPSRISCNGSNRLVLITQR